MLRGPLRRATLAALALHLVVVGWFARRDLPPSPPPFAPVAPVVSDDFEVAITEAIEPEARIAIAPQPAPSRAATTNVRRETASAVVIPENAKGIRVTVRVRAKEQFADGSRPTPDAKQGLGGSATIGKIEDKKDHVDIQLPSASVGYRTRSCGFGVAIAPTGLAIGGGCAAGVAIRVVETHLVREERL